MSRSPFSLLAETLEVDRQSDHWRIGYGLHDVQNVEGRLERAWEPDGVAQGGKRGLGDIDGHQNSPDPPASSLVTPRPRISSAEALDRRGIRKQTSYYAMILATLTVTELAQLSKGREDVTR